MKVSRKAILIALAGMLTAGAAYADTAYSAGRSANRPVSFEYNSYYSQDEAAASPSDRPAPPPVAGDAVATDSSGCSSCGGSSCGCDTCGGVFDPCCTIDGEQWKLFGQNECLKCRGVTIGGYIIQSYTYNPDNPADRFNGPVTWTDRANEYQLNRLQLTIEKATKSEDCCWDVGYRVDALYGTDNRFVTAADLETRGYFTSPKWSTQRFYGLALPQAYAELAYDDWKIKIGHFFAPCGYEGVDSIANFFPNLPYTFQYGEPFTHTGILAMKKVSDGLSVGGGLITGWDNFVGDNPNLGVHTVLTRTWEDKSTMTFYQVFSNEPTLTGVFRQRYLQTLAYTIPLNENLTSTTQSDYGFQNDAFQSGRDADWYGINQYLMYKVSDCTGIGLRTEWFRDEDGARVGGFLGQTPTGSDRGLNVNRFGYAGNFYEITWGMNYKFNANTMIRPYVRWDWFEANDPTTVRQGTLPFDGGNKNHQTLLGFDYVLVY